MNTKRTKEINYFANLRLLSCHTEICKTDDAFNELPFPPVQSARTESLESPFRQANGERQISIFNIMDY